MVTTMWSEKATDETWVGTPPTMASACFVTAGKRSGTGVGGSAVLVVAILSGRVCAGRGVVDFLMFATIRKLQSGKRAAT
jgi:hypothetical protein